MKHGNWDKTSDKNIKSYTSMAKKSVKNTFLPPLGGETHQDWPNIKLKKLLRMKNPLLRVDTLIKIVIKWRKPPTWMLPGGRLGPQKAPLQKPNCSG